MWCESSKQAMRCYVTTQQERVLPKQWNFHNPVHARAYLTSTETFIIFAQVNTQHIHKYFVWLIFYKFVYLMPCQSFTQFVAWQHFFFFGWGGGYLDVFLLSTYVVCTEVFFNFLLFQRIVRVILMQLVVCNCNDQPFLFVNQLKLVSIDVLCKLQF